MALNRRTLKLAIALLLICALPTLAQSSSAVVGTVFDSGGAVIPGATITIVSPDTGYKRVALSNETGNYSVTPLQPGVYDVTIELEGFEKFSSPGVVLQVGQTARIDAALKVGSLQDAVQVSAQAPLLNTDTATVGDVVEQLRVVQLPLNGRSFLQLALLVPGTTVSIGGTSDAPILQTGPVLNINGSRPTHNGFSLDGVTTTDYYFSHLTASTSVEAIQEFKVLSGVYSAEFGFKDGGQVSVVSRSGTNGFHGSLFEFIRNDKLDAKNFFDPPKQPIPAYRQNQYGFSLGGPIVKDRTHFFVNWEGLKTRQGVTRTASVPTQAIRDGDFSGLAAIFDPLTTSATAPFRRDQFPNNRIPAERINPGAKVLMSVLPLPNIAGAPLGRNFVSTPKYTNDSDQVNVRVDHRFSDADNVFVRYSQNDIDSFNPFEGNLPGFGTKVFTFGKNVAINWVRVFSPDLVNEALVGFNRVSGGFDTVNQALDLSAKAGIERFTNLPPAIRGVPPVVTGFFNSWGDTAFTIVRWDNTFQYRDNLRIHAGAHNLAVGAEVYRQQFNLLVPIRPRGSFTFNGFYTSPQFGSTTGGNGFADFLLGFPASGTGAVGNHSQDSRSTWFSGYVQDDWRVRHNLTLNIGLRYEYVGPYTDVANRFANFDFANNRMVVASNDGKYGPEADFAQFGSRFPYPFVSNKDAGWDRSLVIADRNNWSPRFGFAYSPNKTLVMRGGYTLVYGLNPLNLIAVLDRNPPYRNNYIPATQDRIPVKTIQNLFAGATDISMSPVEHNWRNSYTSQWSFALEQQIGSKVVGSLTYVGSKSTKLDSLFAGNTPRGTSDLTAPLDPRRPYPLLPAFALTGTDGFSTYHGMQFRFQVRNLGGLSLSADHTWSKTIDNTSTSTGGAGDIGGGDPYNRNAYFKGNAAFDVRHRFVLSTNYDLPFGHGNGFFSGSNPFARAIISGWRIGGITTLSSGRYFGVSVQRSSVNNGVGDRPDVLRDPNLERGQQDPARWFDTTAFAQPANGKYGNLGRNTLVGPGTINFDFTLARDIRVVESQKLEFRMEVFNIFNHPGFDLPGTTVGTPNFGVIAATARAPRQIQFALKYVF